MKDGIISGEIFYDDYAVKNVYCCVHEKRYADPGTPKTMRADYEFGLNDFRSEWVCPKHTGYARQKFAKWWNARAAYGYRQAHGKPSRWPTKVCRRNQTITVKSVAGEKFERIAKCVLGERPVMREPGDGSAEINDWPSNSPGDLGVSDYEEDIPF